MILRRTPSRGLPPALLLAVLALALSGCDAGGERTPEEHLQSALEYRAQGDLRATVIELKNALQQAPDNAEARWQLGQTYVRLGDGQAAAEELERARELGYDSDRLAIELMRALVLQGEYRKVLATLDDMPRAEVVPDLLTLRAIASLRVGRIEEAERSFRKILELSPGAAEAHLGLARVAAARNDGEEAERQVDLSLESAGNNVQAWLFKGEISLGRNDYDGARAAFRTALELTDETNAKARAGLARALLGLNEVETAERHIEALAERDIDAPLVNYLKALVARRKGDIEEAERTLRRVLSVVPDHPQSLLLLGSIHFSNGETAQAEEALTRFLAQSPGHVAATKMLSSLYAQQKELDRALELLEELAHETPDDPQVLAMLGNAYMRRGDLEKGRTHMQRAVELAPDIPALRTQLAAGHLAAGAIENAVTELQSVIQQNPEFARADVLLVFTHMRGGDYELAFDTARVLSEKYPQSAVPHNLMGVAREAQRQRDEARSHYERALETQPEYAAPAFNLARLDYQAGKLAAARARYEKLLEQQESHPRALLALARIAADEGRTAASVDYLERARSADERFLAPRLLLAEHYLRRGRVRDALAPAEEAERIAPGDPRVLTSLGRAQLASGETEDALRTFERLVERAPESAPAHLQLGLAHTQAGDLGGARDALEAALALEGDYLRAKVALANLALHTGQTERALEYARAIQRQHPDAVAGQILEGDAYLTQGQPQRAAATYEAALARVQTSRLVIKVHGAKARAGDVDGAVEVLRRHLAERPNDVPVRLALASFLHQLGDREAAQQEYQRVLQTQPRNPLALNNLAWLYHELGDERGLDLAEEAYRLVPERPEIADTYGWLLLRDDKVEQGLRVLRKAAQEAPGNGDIRYHLAVGLARVGQRDNARRELEALLDGNQNFPERGKAQELLEKLR